MQSPFDLIPAGTPVNFQSTEHQRSRFLNEYVPETPPSPVVGRGRVAETDLDSDSDLESQIPAAATLVQEPPPASPVTSKAEIPTEVELRIEGLMVFSAEVVDELLAAGTLATQTTTTDLLKEVLRAGITALHSDSYEDNDEELYKFISFLKQLMEKGEKKESLSGLVGELRKSVDSIDAAKSEKDLRTCLETGVAYKKTKLDPEAGYCSFCSGLCYCSASI